MESGSIQTARIRHPLLLGELVTASLLGLEVLVKKVQGLFVGLGTAHDGEHALASLIVRSLGNRDAGTRVLADVAYYPT